MRHVLKGIHDCSFSGLVQELQYKVAGLNYIYCGMLVVDANQYVHVSTIKT